MGYGSLLSAKRTQDCVDSSRIVGDAAAHDGDSSITVDGKLDKDLVTKKDQALEEHVRLGLTWEVLAASVGQQQCL